MQSCNDPFLYSVTLNRARGPGTPFVMLASNSSVSLRYRALVMGVSSGHGAGRWYRLNTCCFLKSTHGDFSGKIKARLGSALDMRPDPNIELADALVLLRRWNSAKPSA